MASIEEKVSVALQRVNAAIKLFDPIEVFGLYSGGHDSFSACVVASLHPRFSGVVHINTGIGVQATREHVRNTSKEKSWKILEYKATENCKADGTPDPQIYEQLVMEYGFPGPFHHNKMYNRLKERQLERLERDCGACMRSENNPRRVMFVTGCRSDESVRRMANTKEVDPDGRRVWVAAIHDWSKLDTTELIAHTRSTRNPVVDLIHKSGECLCGAYAQRGELHELGTWDLTRSAHNEIIRIQNKVMQKFPWGWEDAPPAEYLEEKRGQEFFPEMKQHLCWKCNLAARATVAG